MSIWVMPYKIRSELASLVKQLFMDRVRRLPESPFQDIGGADGFPALWRKVIKYRRFPIRIVYMVFIYINTI